MTTLNRTTMPLQANLLHAHHQQQQVKARSTLVNGIAPNGVAAYDEENQRPNTTLPRSVAMSQKMYVHQQDDKENAVGPLTAQAVMNAAAARSTRARSTLMGAGAIVPAASTTSLMQQKPRRVLQEIKPDNGVPAPSSLSSSTARRTGASITSSSHLASSSHHAQIHPAPVVASAIPSLASLSASQRINQTTQPPRSSIMTMASASILSSTTSYTAVNKQPHIPLAQQSLSSFSGPSMASNPSSVLSVTVTSSTSSSHMALYPPTHSNSVTYPLASGVSTLPNFTSSTLSSFCAASEVSQLTAVQEKSREIEQERRMIEAMAPVHSSSTATYVESSTVEPMAMESDDIIESHQADEVPCSQATEIYNDQEDTSAPCDVNTSSVIVDAGEEDPITSVVGATESTATAMDLCSSPMPVERSSEMDLTNLSASLNGASSSGSTSMSSSVSGSSAVSPFGSVPSSLPASEAHLWGADLTSEIVTYWFASEEKHRPAADYLRHQPDLNGKMREILIDWLQEVVARFRLQTETMFLAVALLDRFLSCKAVGRKKLQLVGCVALLLAAKYEEIYIPAINDFLVISDHAYTRDHVLQMESIMLNGLNFQLTQVTSLRFMQRFMNLPHADFFGPAVREGAVLPVLLAQYLLELTLQYVKFLEYKPSTIAAAVVYLVAHHVHVETARQTNGLQQADPAQCTAADAIASQSYVWSDSMQRETQHTVPQLLPCLADLYAHWSSLTALAASALASGTVASGGPGNKCLAVYRKYGKERLGQVNQAVIHKPSIILE